jgi:hypothetical protein
MYYHYSSVKRLLVIWTDDDNTLYQEMLCASPETLLRKHFQFMEMMSA